MLLCSCLEVSKVQGCSKRRMRWKMMMRTESEVGLEHGVMYWEEVGRYLYFLPCVPCDPTLLSRLVEL